LDKGDIIRIVTAKGGGWGDPRQRRPEAIQADLHNGYITPRQAVRYYGIKPGGRGGFQTRPYKVNGLQ